MVEYNTSWYKPIKERRRYRRPPKKKPSVVSKLKQLANAVIAEEPKSVPDAAEIHEEKTEREYELKVTQEVESAEIKKDNRARLDAALQEHYEYIKKREEKREKHSSDIRDQIIDFLAGKEIIALHAQDKHKFALFGLGDSLLREYLKELKEDETRQIPVDWISAKREKAEAITDPPLERFAGSFRRPTIMISKDEVERLKGTPGYAPHNVRKLIWAKEAKRREEARRIAEERKEQELIDKFTKEPTVLRQEFNKALEQKETKKPEFQSRLDELAQKGTIFAKSDEWEEKEPATTPTVTGGALTINPGNATTINFTGINDKEDDDVDSLILAEESCEKLAEHFKVKREIIELKSQMSRNKSSLISDILSLFKRQDL